MTERKSTIVNEFTDVITESSLIPTHSPNSPEFTTVTTETILVSSSSESSENNFDSPENLIKHYDELFDKREEYNKFIKQKLANFERTIELQFFDLHYNRHRNESHNIRAKRNAAQKLLEEADQLQKEHDQQQKQFLYFIATMTRQNLKRKLYKPVKINEEQTHPRLDQRARRLPDPPVQTRFPRTVSAHPRGEYFRRMTTPGRVYTTPGRVYSTPEREYSCFKCGSKEHLMYHCPKYRCKTCRRLAPGHRFRECPRNNEEHEEDPTGYHDVEGFLDGNLSGEN
jgi:hypothetical protein